jgi:hypothetical protein
VVATDLTLRSLLARKAAHRKAAIYGKSGTAAARAALSERFVTEARALLGPDATPADVTRSALQLRKAFYADLSAKSLAARARRKAAS